MGSLASAYEVMFPDQGLNLGPLPELGEQNFGPWITKEILSPYFFNWHSNSLPDLFKKKKKTFHFRTLLDLQIVVDLIQKAPVYSAHNFP